MKSGHLAVPAVIALSASTAGLAMAVTVTPVANGVRQDQCPAVRNYDLAKIARAARREASAYHPLAGLEEVRVPSWATRRPPADASIVIRVRLPGGGLYAQDEKAVIWREANGSWWGWRTVTNDPNHAPPPPPPLRGSPEEKQLEQETAAEAALGYPIWFSSDGLYEGRLDPEQSARLESAYADPCRKLEPDRWPSKIPLLRPENGSRVHKCEVFQDSTFYLAEFTEAGGAPRNIFLPCGYPGTLNGVLVTWSAHAGLPQRPARRLSHEEIDAIRNRR